MPSTPKTARRVVAVIPARGGSKGIPGKNLLPIEGRSLLRRAVDAALQSRQVDEVIVSSDDKAILREAERAGACAIVRPASLASDTASSEAALLHALDWLASRDGSIPDILVFVQCTSPFVTGADIDGVLSALASEGANCALSVSVSHDFLWLPDAERGGVLPLGHELGVRPRRQDRTAQFVETGAVYAMDAAGFQKARHRFFGKVASYVTDPVNAIEIDTPQDVLVARTIAGDQERTAWQDCLPARIGALAFDFDGVMTDDKVLVSENGVEMVRASRRDGMGLERVRKLGLPMVVISKETNPVVARRCEKLKLECFHGEEDKASSLRVWAERKGVDASSIVFVGNDVNDLPVVDLVGAALAPEDAHPSFLDRASGILPAKGGEGAVRQLCDEVAARLEKSA